MVLSFMFFSSPPLVPRYCHALNVVGMVVAIDYDCVADRTMVGMMNIATELHLCGEEGAQSSYTKFNMPAV